MSNLAASEAAQLCKSLVFITVSLPVLSMLFCAALHLWPTALPKPSRGAEQRPMQVQAGKCTKETGSSQFSQNIGQHLIASPEIPMADVPSTFPTKHEGNQQLKLLCNKQFINLTKISEINKD